MTSRSPRSRAPQAATPGRRLRTRRGKLPLALAVWAFVLSSCGGGTPVSSNAVAFIGFEFRTSDGAVTSLAPVEDLSVTPPQFGAPLDTTIIFRFDGEPEGPFDAVTLPVFAFAADVPPGTGAAPGTLVLALGSYQRVGDTVEFQPQLPTAPVAAPGLDPAGKPGLLPGTLYHARVSDVAGAKLANLAGPGGEVVFETASDPSKWYPKGQGAPPVVVGIDPPTGTGGLWPGLLSETAGEPGAAPPAADVFGPGPAFRPTVTYDRALDPAVSNLLGTDLDGDGRLDPTFFLRAPNSRLWIGGSVPTGASFGNPEAFPVLASLLVQDSAGLAGPDLVLHASGTLPDPSVALLAAPSSMSPASDASLLYVVLPVSDSPDLFTAVDQALGDPSATAMPDTSPVALPTGIDGLVGLTTLPDGRLVGIDGALNRIVELRPEIERQRPDGPPRLVDLIVGAGPDGKGFEGPALDPGWEYLDLVSLPSGRLLALARVTASTALPVLLEVQPVDPDLDGDFDGGDGSLTGELIAVFDAPYVDLAVIDEHRAWALDREHDRIDRVDWSLGQTETILSDVGAWAAPLPQEPSPVRCLAFPVLELDLDVELAANAADQAVVALKPRGVLPFGVELSVMQRHTLASLVGDSAMTAAPVGSVVPLGAIELARLVTAEAPGGGGDATPAGVVSVSDVYLEEFLDASGESPAAVQGMTPAIWGPSLTGGNGPDADVLRASVGVTEEVGLGDLLPLASPAFDPTIAYDPATPLADGGWTTIFLDTDAQSLPLPSGATPGLTEPVLVTGGIFRFGDVIIPEGVRIVAAGSQPLQIHATGRVEIHGVIDVAGTDGLDDDTFDSGFLAVPGGLGGPAAGRGGDGQPPTLSPFGPQTIDQYATPERGGRGTGPVIQANGTVALAPVGGFGGLSTLGYDPDGAGFPKVPKIPTTCAGNSGNEHHRPPGGGGGSFRAPGLPAHQGTGVYRVQSSSSWGAFNACTFNDKIRDALYGNEENAAAGLLPSAPVQCVYMDGTPSAPNRFKPGGLPGASVFSDGNPDNDYFGEGGEFAALFGGQGGGAGGSRIDSMDHLLWSIDKIGSPLIPAAPAFYPNLLTGNLFTSPARFDAKGGGGGGGGGAVLIRAFGDIIIGRTGTIDASGGNGGGGETVGNSNWTGGGGGGSGGAIVLQSASEIVLHGDPDHVTPGMLDSTGARGALLDVSGGRGYDANTNPKYLCSQSAPTHDWTRSDGGNGGFGVIQLQEGGGDGVPTIHQGAFAGARIAPVAKLGPWTHAEDILLGAPSSSAAHPLDKSPWPTSLWYIDMLHYRWFRYEEGGTRHRFWFLQGSDPPLVVPDGSTPAQGVQLDTPMLDYHGRRVVREPEPQKILASHFGVVDQEELLADPDGSGPLPTMPGVPYDAEAAIPLALHLTEPAGLQPLVDIAGVTQVDPSVLLERLPLIHPSLTPPPISSSSRGTSRWLDFHGVAMRMRNEAGRPPPFFAPVHGTLLATNGAPSPEADGRVELASSVPGLPLHYVANTPLSPFDPGLFGGGSPPDPAFNDIAVNAPEYSIDNAVTDNAHVSLVFQGAYGVRAGSQVPDPTTLTEWTGDLPSLSGYPLVRFSVVFQLTADIDAWPFGPDSKRPAVDRVRVRMSY